MTPTLGRIVHYRGREGLHAMRAAIVTADINSLDQRGVGAGKIQALTDDTHVHLWVFTPSMAGGFAEFNVAEGEPGEDGLIPPGTWTWPPRIPVVLA